MATGAVFSSPLTYASRHESYTEALCGLVKDGRRKSNDACDAEDFSMTDVCCNPGGTCTGMGLVRTMAERYCHGLGTCVNKEIQQ